MNNKNKKISEEEAIHIAKTAVSLVSSSDKSADWEVADKLIALLYDDYGCGDCFPDVYDDSDIRKYLLDLWLWRYQIIYEFRGVSIFQLYYKVKDVYPDMPGWMGNIADVAGSYVDVSDFIAVRLDDIDFDEELYNCIRNLPINRDSCEQLIDATRSFDIPDLYIALADYFQGYLSYEEAVDIKSRYKDLTGEALELEFFEFDETNL